MLVRVLLDLSQCLTSFLLTSGGKIAEIYNKEDQKSLLIQT